jgi:hypothetical protein
VRLALTKWYVDVVTDDGRTAIAYWGAVRVGRVHAAVAGLATGDGPSAVRSFTLRAGPAPAPAGDRLQWHTTALALDVAVTRVAAPIAHRLFADDAGAVDWTAWSPAADVRITTPHGCWQGAGYAERLDLSIAPWAVPVDTFRWGRWVDATGSFVWIAWDGPHPLRLAWLDGTAVPLATAGPDRIGAGDARLHLTDHLLLTDATLGSQLTALAPLRAVVDRVAHSHQLRHRSRGTLTPAAGPPRSGWAIHEVVRWR